MSSIRDIPVYKTATYAIILIYAVLMYRSVPTGDAGKVPELVLPLLLVFALIQLVCAVSETANSCKQVLWQPVRKLTESDSAEDSVYEYSGAGQEADSNLTEDVLMIGWVVTGYVMVYLFGVASGGFVFVLSVMIANGHSIIRSGSVAGLLAGSLLGFSSFLGIRFWTGIVVFPDFVTI